MERPYPISDNATVLAERHHLLFNILKRKYWLSKTKYEHLWAGFNFLLTIILVADIIYGIYPGIVRFNIPAVWWIEVVLALVFSLNTLVHMYYFLWHVFVRPYEVPPKWKELVGIKDKGYDGRQWKFTSDSPEKVDMNELETPSAFRLNSFNFWHRIQCWKGPVLLKFKKERICSDNMVKMRNVKLRPCKKSDKPHLPKLISDKQEFLNAQKPKPIHTQKTQDLFCKFQKAKDAYIQEERSLEEIQDLTKDYYKKAAELRESYNPHKVAPEVQKMLDAYKKKTADALRMNIPLEQFKSYLPPGAAENNVSILRKNRYQQFIRTPSPLDDDPPAVCSGNVWANLRVTQGMLNLWSERLKKWICQTIIARLVDEIENLNKRLIEMKLSGVQIGGTNIMTLQHLAAMRNASLPTLLPLVPYLDAHSSQEYIVKRMKELGIGVMRAFKWNGGSSLRGRPWSNDLPNDSDIILHLFSTYLDSVLPCDSVSGKKQTFTNNYVRKVPDKPIYVKGRHYLYQSKTDLPHFVVVIDEEVYGVPKGQNNLFSAIVLFLHYIKIKQKNMLGRVNLGPSGLNILGVLDW